MNKIFVFVLLLISISLYAKSSPVVKYVLNFNEASAHYIEVRMEIDNLKSDRLKVSMPVWAPGSYMIREFEKNVEGFISSTPSGNILKHKKINKATWEVETRGVQSVKISYRVYAFELSVRTSFVDDQLGFISGSSVFMYLDNTLDLQSTIEIIPAANWKQINTTLENVNGNKWMYSAPNYDILADSPISIGNYEVINFDAAKIKHEIVMMGKGNYNVEKLKEDITNIVEMETAIFKENPCTKYIFFVHNHSTAGGGLEHLNSCVLQMNRLGYEPEGAYNGFLSLVAHEYFHLWNVKRLRPKTLLPYDYSAENYTDLLYVAEGFTAYYDDLIVERCGFVNENDYLNTLSNSFTALENPGDTIQSIVEASWDAWIKYYRPNENSSNTTVSYYTKGSIIALMIDLAIMDATDGKRSMDDVMHLLYDDNYKKHLVGYDESDLLKAIKTVSGLDMNIFFANHVHQTEKMDYNFFLEKAGLKVINKNEKQKTAYLGVATSVKDGKLMVTGVERNSPAWKEGINVNDELVSIDSLRLSEDVAKLIQKKNPGDRLNIILNRNGFVKPITVTLTASEKRAYALDKIELSTSKQDRIYKKWLRLN